MADPRALVRVWDTDGGVDSIPDDAHYFLGYDDGNPVIQEILARFPNAFIIPITTVPEANNLAARVADCETNAFTPSQAAYWAQQKINHLLARWIDTGDKSFHQQAAALGARFHLAVPPLRK